MGSLLSGLGLGNGCGDDNSLILIILVIILLCSGNNGFLGNNECRNECDQQGDWVWILVVIAILFLCNGNNGLFGGGCDNRKPC